MHLNESERRRPNTEYILLWKESVFSKRMRLNKRFEQYNLNLCPINFPLMHTIKIY